MFSDVDRVAAAGNNDTRGERHPHHKAGATSVRAGREMIAADAHQAIPSKRAGIASEKSPAFLERSDMSS
jgi:hypothetical protein